MNNERESTRFYPIMNNNSIQSYQMMSLEQRVQNLELKLMTLQIELDELRKDQIKILFAGKPNDDMAVVGEHLKNEYRKK